MTRPTIRPGRARDGADAKRGIFMSLSVFLMFSALLLLAYNLSVANTRNSDTLTAQAALDRVTGQYDAVMHGLSQLPNATLNYTVNGTSLFMLTEYMPTQFLNSSNGNFTALKSFLEGYSSINVSVNLSNALPNPLLIDPQNMTVTQTSNTSLMFQPSDNSSGRSASNYTIDVVINGTPTLTVSWNPLNSVLASSSDAMFVNGTLRVVGGQTVNVSAYVNKTMLNKLEFDWGDFPVVNATFNGTSRIGSLNLTAVSVATPQMLTNANFSANDNDWVKTIPTFTTIAWFNSGQTGGSENITVTGSGRNVNAYIAQNETAPSEPTAGSLRWCYRVTRWSSGTASNLSVYIRSPGGSGTGARIDSVTITGTTAWICRSNATLPAAVLNDSGVYQFSALAHLQTTGGGAGKFVSVLLDDFQLNFTMPVNLTVTAAVNMSSAIDRVAGGMVPANVSVAVGNEFKKVVANG
ncbi:Uncharacterised protein [uncultured archaeon]|nr:Uncharacterised protein [uncultured archaeon]